MKTVFRKTLVTIISILWLIFVGYIAVLLFAFAGDAPTTKGDLQLFVVIIYFVFGLGPVLSFIFVMKRLDEPLSKLILIVMALLAAIPMLIFLSALL